MLILASAEYEFLQVIEEHLREQEQQRVRLII